MPVTPVLLGYDAGAAQLLPLRFVWQAARAEGRMTASASGVRTYNYDEGDRITSVSGAGSATFGYDADGRRMTKTVNGQTTVYVYDAMGNLAEERQGQRAVTARLAI